MALLKIILDFSVVIISVGEKNLAFALHFFIRQETIVLVAFKFGVLEDGFGFFFTGEKSLGSCQGVIEVADEALKGLELLQIEIVLIG